MRRLLEKFALPVNFESLKGVQVSLCELSEHAFDLPHIWVSLMYCKIYNCDFEYVIDYSVHLHFFQSGNKPSIRMQSGIEVAQRTISQEHLLPAFQRLLGCDQGIIADVSLCCIKEENSSFAIVRRYDSHVDCC